MPCVYLGSSHCPKLKPALNTMGLPINKSFHAVEFALHIRPRTVTRELTIIDQRTTVWMYETLNADLLLICGKVEIEGLDYVC